METAPCPECNYELALPRPREGQRLPCPNCGVELEVVSAQPLDFDWADTDDDLDVGDRDDDWDDDWDDQDQDQDQDDQDDTWEEI